MYAHSGLGTVAFRFCDTGTTSVQFLLLFLVQCSTVVYTVSSCHVHDCVGSGGLANAPVPLVPQQYYITVSYEAVTRNSRRSYTPAATAPLPAADSDANFFT
jgi:hypothetical protein